MAGQFLGTLFLVSLVLFLIVSATPGDIRQIHNLSEATASALHLDKPAALRFFLWLGNCLRLDFGISLVDGTPVARLLALYAPATLLLAGGSVLLSLLLSLPIGILLGLRPESRLSQALAFGVYSLSSVPGFVLGYIALAIVFGFFRFYSTSPPEGVWPLGPFLAYYLLPVAVLSIGNGTLGEFVRFISLEARQVGGSMYLKAARARGAPLGPHFFRSMVVPLSNIVATNLAALLGGLVVVERIFNFHGLGWLGWESTLKRDFFVVMGISVVMAFAVRCFLLISDLLAQGVDPRRRS